MAPLPRRVSHETFLPAGLLSELWGLGRTNVGRITNDEFGYLLKYVTKSGALPEWALSRRRLRIFQSSRGFYTSAPEEKKVHQKTGISRRRTSSLGQRIERWRRTALLQTGEDFSQVILGEPFADLLAAQIYLVALEGRYLGGGHIIINDSRELLPWIKQT